MMPVGKIEAFGPWTAHIEAMDEALAANDTDDSIRAWRLAYSAALSHPGWLGLFTVATASLRLGTSPSLAPGDLLDRVLSSAPTAIAQRHTLFGRGFRHARRSRFRRAMFASRREASVNCLRHERGRSRAPPGAPLGPTRGEQS